MGRIPDFSDREMVSLMENMWFDGTNVNLNFRGPCKAYNPSSDFTTAISTTTRTVAAAEQQAFGEDGVGYYSLSTGVYRNPSGTTTAGEKDLGFPSIYMAVAKDGYWLGFRITAWNNATFRVGGPTILSAVVAALDNNPALGLQYLALGTDGTTWIINQYGNIQYVTIDGVMHNFKGPRGLFLTRIWARGTASNYKMLAMGYNKMFGGDSCAPITYQRVISGWNRCGIAGNGLFSANSEMTGAYLLYLFGHQPSTWPYPRGKHNKIRYTLQDNTFHMTTPGYKAAEARGWALLGKTPRTGGQTGIWSDRDAYFGSFIGLASGLSGTPNRLYLVRRAGTGNGDANTGSDASTGPIVEFSLSTTNQSLYSSSLNLGGVASMGNRTVATGLDGTVLAGSNTISMWNGSAWTVINTDATGTAHYKDVACANASNVWKIDTDGTVWKWSSGTTWTSTSIYPSRFARAIAAASDGGLWFIDEKGKFKFRSSAGVITTVAGTDNIDWCRVAAAGSSSNYKLVAVDRMGNLWSADSTRNLELEGIAFVDNVAVAANGMCAIAFKPETETATLYGRVYIGWIRGSSVPSTWPYKRSV